MLATYGEERSAGSIKDKCPVMDEEVCLFHDKHYSHYNSSTGDLYCESCLSCLEDGENALCISDFVSAPTKYSIEDVEEMKKTCTKFIKTFEYTYQRYKTLYDSLLKNKEKLVSKLANFSDSMDSDSKELMELIKKLKDRSKSSISKTLKRSIKAITKIKINSKLFSSEISNLKNSMKNIEVELKECSQKYSWYYQRVLVMRKVLGIENPATPFELFSVQMLNHFKIYLKEPYHINTDIDLFRAFSGVNLLDDVQRVYEKELFTISQGVQISAPVRFKALKSKSTRVFASLSHNGIFASNPVNSGSMFLEFVNLLSEEKVSFPIKTWAMVGFYDEKAIILMEGEYLHEGFVSSIFEKHSLTYFKNIRHTPKVSEYADVSLLHSTRILIYATYRDCGTRIFNVDTRKLLDVNTDREAFEYASMTGIRTGVRGVLKECGNSHNTCTLNNDGSTTCLLEHNQNYLCVVLPSHSNPNNLEKALKLYSDGYFFLEGTKPYKFDGPISFKCNVSIVRLYSDVFLIFDKAEEEWNLVRIIVP